MPSFTRIIALVLVALWVPTTAHCALEAIGELPPESSTDGCCQPTDGCTDDACHLIEGQSFSLTKSTLQAPAPEFKLLECLNCLLAAISARDATPPAASVPDVVRPLEWTPTWQFARRAAPLSRAPSTLV